MALWSDICGEKVLSDCQDAPLKDMDLVLQTGNQGGIFIGRRKRVVWGNRLPSTQLSVAGWEMLGIALIFCGLLMVEMIKPEAGELLRSHWAD